jgi:hypothetical protein
MVDVGQVKLESPRSSARAFISEADDGQEYKIYPCILLGDILLTPVTHHTLRQPSIHVSHFLFTIIFTLHLLFFVMDLPRKFHHLLTSTDMHEDQLSTFGHPPLATANITSPTDLVHYTCTSDDTYSPRSMVLLVSQSPSYPTRRLVSHALAAPQTVTVRRLNDESRGLRSGRDVHGYWGGACSMIAN